MRYQKKGSALTTINNRAKNFITSVYKDNTCNLTNQTLFEVFISDPQRDCRPMLLKEILAEMGLLKVANDK